MSASILQFATIYSLYSGCIICSLGVVGNAINILVFTQLKLFRGNQSAFYLITESIASLLYQFVSISITILISIYGDDATGRSLIWCRFRYISGATFAFVPLYTTCFAAIDQFCSTSYRVNLRQVCTLKLAQTLMFTVVSTWTSHSVMFGFFFDIVPSVGCIIINSTFLQYVSFFLYPIVGGFLPIAIASMFSFLAFRNVRRIVRRQIPIVRRRLDRQITSMFLMRAACLVILGLPYNSYRIYILNFPIPRSKPLEFAIGQLVQSIFLSLFAFNYAVG